MQRRSFVKGLAAALAAAPSFPAIGRVLADHLAGLRRDLMAAPDEQAFWQRVGNEFSLQPGLIHLNNGSIGATPVPVQEAHKAYLDRMESSPYDYTWSGFPDHTLARLQAQAAAFLRAGEDEVFLTRNTTEAMNLISTGMRLEPGDEILTTDHEHPGGMMCWLHMAALQGVVVRQVHLPTPAASKDQILDLIRQAVTPRTRVCSFSHINTTTGLRMPIAEIAGITAPRDILLICDGAQAPGMLDVDVKALQVDAYASSSHKWMLAPKGTGLLYVRREAQDRIRPVSVYTGGSDLYFSPYTAGGGTRNTPQLLAHGVTMDFHNVLGRDRVEQRALELNRYLRERLAPHARLQPVTPQDPALASAMVSYRIEGMHPNALYSALHEHHMIIKRHSYNWVVAGNPIKPENVPIIRLSTHIYNDQEQIDRFAEALFGVLDDSPTVLEPVAAQPKVFSVSPNYPNPFNSGTTIKYHIPADEQVEIGVYNAQGQLVEVLLDAWQQAGPHELQWHAPKHASGTYFCRVVSGPHEQVQKMLLLR